MPRMFAGRPIIGIVGGIGAGKSLVARIFGELGCMVIDADEQVGRAYEREDVRRTLRQWWGQQAFNADGTVNRSFIARRVFSDEDERRRLEALLHPIVADMRRQTMAAAAGDSQVVAFVWDAPLLVEAGLHRECDAIVFVDAPEELRRQRVLKYRSWQADEWERREKSQLPLDKKRRLANYIVTNAAGADDIRRQVREVLFRILHDRHDSGSREAAGWAEGPAGAR